MIITIYKKAGCKPCDELDSIMSSDKLKEKIKHFEIKTLIIKDVIDKEGKLLKQYGVDEEDNKIKLEGVITEFPSAIIEGNYIYGVNSIIDFIKLGYIDHIKGVFCPEVHGECLGHVKCKKYQIFTKNTIPYGNCSDLWETIFLLDMRKENSRSSDRIIGKLDKIEDSIKLLNEINLSGAEFSVNTIKNGFDSIRKQQLAIEIMSKGNEKGQERKIIQES